MKTGALVQSLIEAARCLGCAQQAHDAAAAAHWDAEVTALVAQLRAREVPGTDHLSTQAPTIP
jgi:hypothetical protein